METKTTCATRLRLDIIMPGCLIIAVLMQSIAFARLELQGTNIGAVRFDAIIELNRYSPHSDRHDYTILFARYWVARDYYTAAVVWAEPQSTDLFFPANPVGLSAVSNKQAFTVCQKSNKKGPETYKKPMDKRGVLRHTVGVYPIGNIRFAEREALAQRLYAVDLREFMDENQVAEGTSIFNINAIDGNDIRDVAKVKLRSNGKRIDSMRLFNAEQRMLKDIRYEYETKGGKTRLRKQTVVLPERPMKVGFNVGSMTVKLDGKKYNFKDLEVKHHGGTRTCTVEYGLFRLVDREVSLPVQVTVREGKEGRVLRSVRMMNFQQIKLDAVGAEKTALRFSASTAYQHEYEKLRMKYWQKDPTEIEKTDVQIIEQLRSRFKKAAVATGVSAGEKLKYLNILIQLDIILGDQKGLERSYRSYLSTLTENKLHWMTLVGGFGFIETFMFAERHTVGKKLLSLWVDTVLGIHEDEAILLFARRQLAKKRLWPTIKMLETFSMKKNCSAEARFEAQALRCIALANLCKLLETDDIAKKGLIAEVQAAWVSSFGKEKLDTMLSNGITQSKRSFASVADPMESQNALREQLSKIEQEISKEK